MLATRNLTSISTEDIAFSISECNDKSVTLRLRSTPEGIAEAAAILRGGGTVAFPTETVYGLGADALSPTAVAKIFIAKQRPAWDPLIVHIADWAQLPTIAAHVPEPARLWARQFWPGPLTLLLPRAPAIPDAVTAGRPRVGVRMPRHPVAQALLHAAGVPVAAPSANVFGHVSPTTAAHVLHDLDRRIDAVLDGGSCEHGIESTVVDACEDPCVVYRPGAVTLDQLRAVWPRVGLHRPTPTLTAPQALPSPGVGLRHYAPRAPLQLIEYGSSQANNLLAALQKNSQGTGVLLPEGLLSPAQAAALPLGVLVEPWGPWSRPEELARHLFAGFRALDARHAVRIVCPLPRDEGIGAALCDRLRKAARTS